MKTPAKKKLKSLFLTEKERFGNMRLKFVKPKSKEASKIRAKAGEVLSGKVRGIPAKEVIKSINEKAKPYEEGKVKATRWKGSVDKTFGAKA